MNEKIPINSRLVVWFVSAFLWMFTAFSLYGFFPMFHYFTTGRPLSCRIMGFLFCGGLTICIAILCGYVAFHMRHMSYNDDGILFSGKTVKYKDIMKIWFMDTGDELDIFWVKYKDGQDVKKVCGPLCRESGPDGIDIRRPYFEQGPASIIKKIARDNDIPFKGHGICELYGKE